MITPHDVVQYAITLAQGNALNVQRLGQKADYDVETLQGAVNGCEYWTGGLPSNQSRGILIALTRALGDAEDRAYQRRARQRTA